MSVIYLVVDGGWSNFGEWGKCVDAEQTRRRACNNPTPFNGGAECVGKAVESRKCEGI